MGLTTQSLRTGIASLKQQMGLKAAELSALDGQLGDGDLGVTLSKAFTRLDEVATDLPEDLGQALAACAQAINKVSSSSFGTLMAVSCLAVSKRLAGRTELPWHEVPALLEVARDTISARGRSELGQKTVLDAIDAAARAMQPYADPEPMLAAGLRSVQETIATLRDRPAQIGRARIFAAKSVGLDDPGMRAFEVMLSALAQSPDVDGTT